MCKSVCRHGFDLQNNAASFLIVFLTYNAFSEQCVAKLNSFTECYYFSYVTTSVNSALALLVAARDCADAARIDFLTSIILNTIMVDHYMVDHY